MLPRPIYIFLTTSEQCVRLSPLSHDDDSLTASRRASGKVELEDWPAASERRRGVSRGGGGPARGGVGRGGRRRGGRRARRRGGGGRQCCGLCFMIGEGGAESEFDFSDAEAQDRTAGVVHDAVQQAVMQYGYDDELFQAWRDGEIRRKDLPEEVVAMALDLCERWRAEQERCRRVHAAQRLSRDPGPSRSRSRSRSPNSCRSSVSGCDEG